MPGGLFWYSSGTRILRSTVLWPDTASHNTTATSSEMTLSGRLESSRKAMVRAAAASGGPICAGAPAG